MANQLEVISDVAALKAELVAMDRRFVYLERRVDAKSKDIEATLRRIEASLERYRGMAGAALLLITLAISGGKFLFDLFRG